MASDDEHLRACVRTAAEVIRNRQLRGEQVPEWLRRHQSRCESMLAVSRTRQELASDGGQLEPENLIGTREAAAMLECSTRKAQRLKNDLGARRVASRLLFDRRAVAEYVEARASA
jgi:hypothetical protein